MVEKVKFKEVVKDLIHGGTPSTNNASFWNGSIPWITGADFQNQTVSTIRRYITREAVSSSSTNVVPAGNLLLVTRTGVGKMAIAQQDIAISQDITGVVFDNSVNVNFIRYKLSHEVNYFLNLNQGSIINGITRRDLINFEFSLPDPAEQARIAHILSTVDAAIEQTEALIAKYTRVRTGLMQDLLTRGIDEQGRIRSEATHKFKDSPLGRIPIEWKHATLNEVLAEKKYGISESLDDAEGIPVLRMNNLKGGEADFTDLKFSESIQAKSTLLKPLDILFNRTNSIDYVGRTGIFRGRAEPTSYASYLVKLVPKTFLDAEYLNYWMNLPVSHIAMKVYSTVGVQQANINPTNVGKLDFVYPTSREEQRQIVEKIDTFRNTIREQKSQLQKLQTLKKSLMQDLLSEPL